MAKSNYNMSKMNAILVDDEESARDVLENLLRRFCPNIDVLCKCNNVVDAVKKIKELKPNVVFLDIEMPEYAGYEIINFFEEIDFEIIFVTAYDQYAMRAFEVAAVDYLLKPVDIERLKIAVERVGKKIAINNSKNQLTLLKNTLENKQVKQLLITDKGQQQILNVDEIIAIEAQESYCHIHTTNKKYLVSKNLKHFETVLENNQKFFRIHKSWIINRNAVQSYSKSNFDIKLSNNIVAKLSKYRKEEFEKWILSIAVNE